MANHWKDNSYAVVHLSPTKTPWVNMAELEIGRLKNAIRKENGTTKQSVARIIVE